MKRNIARKLSESFWSKFWKVTIFVNIVAFFTGSFESTDFFTVILTILGLSIIISIIWMVIETIKNLWESWDLPWNK